MCNIKDTPHLRRGKQIPPPPMHLKPRFAIGDYVYPRCDPNQYPRLVTAIMIRPGDRITYMVSDHAGEMEFNDFELSNKKLMLP